MTAAREPDASALALTLYLDGSDDPDRPAYGMLLLDDDFLVLVGAARPYPPRHPAVGRVDRRGRHSRPRVTDRIGQSARAGDRVTVRSRSIVVLCAPTGREAD
jgi:hypothetical protein